MKTNALFNILKYGLTILAVINLILLFGFCYEIPDAIKDKFFTQTPLEKDLYADSTPVEQPEEDAAYQFLFEPKTLIYDGTNTLDLLSGVTLTDRDGAPAELDIYSTIQSTEDSNVKLITYSVKDEEGKEAIAERKLVLNNYYGPALSIGQPYPEILDVELDYILERFLNNELLSANDGYGKNITSALQCSYHIADTKARTADITFTVTNHFDDTITKTITVPISRTKPLIVLDKTSVTIKKGESIDPLSYIASATNEEGNDLTSLITIDGTVNTAVADTYTLTYTLTDRDREQADPVTVKVVVEE